MGTVTGARFSGRATAHYRADRETGHGALFTDGTCDAVKRVLCPHMEPACSQDPGDMSQMTDLVPWVRNIAPADDGLHTPLSGLFWWAWNSNSGAATAHALCSVA